MALYGSHSNRCQSNKMVLPAVKNKKFWQEYKRTEVRVVLGDEMEGIDGGQTVECLRRRKACMVSVTVNWWQVHQRRQLHAWEILRTFAGGGNIYILPAAFEVAAIITECHQQHVTVLGNLRRQWRTFNGDAGRWPFRILQNTNAFSPPLAAACVHG